MQRVFKQIADFFKSLAFEKKVGFFGLTVLILVGVGALFFWAGETSYIPLMSNLSAEDSTRIIRILREKHIPFKVDETGKSILIPQENLYDLRIELATLGLPESSVVGYEIFDRQNIGTTSFIQKVNQRRAQEGELVRTINSIRGIRRSRVHLALPQKSTFIEDQKKSTASVVVDLEPGMQLSDKQVFGIGNLVARAVEGMEISDVVIMNADGKVLSKNPSEPLAAATANQLDYQEKVEADLEKRIESMLARVVGDGHVVARVSADLEFSQVQETQTAYDADATAVLSVEKHNDSMTGSRPGPYGPAGSASNTPGQPPGANSDVKTQTLKNNEVTNYKVPETIRRTTRSVGNIRRLSVAIVVDGKMVKSIDKTGHEVTRVESWPPEKIKEFEDVAGQAVGLDKKRGDTIEIKNMEFSHTDFDEAQRIISEKENKAHIENLVLYAIIGLGILLFFLVTVRPFIKWVTDNTIDNVEMFLPQTIEELEKLHKNSNLPLLEDAMPVFNESVDPTKMEGEIIREKIITLVDSNPHKAALILKDWLHYDQKKKTVELKQEEKGKEKAAS